MRRRQWRRSSQPGSQASAASTYGHRVARRRRRGTRAARRRPPRAARRGRGPSRPRGRRRPVLVICEPMCRWSPRTLHRAEPHAPSNSSAASIRSRELAAVGGAHLGVRLGAHADVDAQGDVGRAAERRAATWFTRASSRERVDHDGADAACDRLLDLRTLSGDAVEDDLPTGEAGRSAFQSSPAESTSALIPPSSPAPGPRARRTPCWRRRPRSSRGGSGTRPATWRCLGDARRCGCVCGARRQRRHLWASSTRGRRRRSAGGRRAWRGEDRGALDGSPLDGFRLNYNRRRPAT